MNMHELYPSEYPTDSTQPYRRFERVGAAQHQASSDSDTGSRRRHRMAYWSEVEMLTPNSWPSHNHDNIRRLALGEDALSIPWQPHTVEIHVDLQRKNARTLNRNLTLYTVWTDDHARLLQDFAFDDFLDTVSQKTPPNFLIRDFHNDENLSRLQSSWDAQGLPQVLHRGDTFDDRAFHTLVDVAQSLCRSHGDNPPVIPQAAPDIWYCEQPDEPDGRSHSGASSQPEHFNGDTRKPPKPSTEAFWLKPQPKSYYMVYFGLKQQIAYRILAAIAAPDNDRIPDSIEAIQTNEQEPSKQDIASFLSFWIDSDGKAVPDSLSISQYARALSCLAPDPRSSQLPSLDNWPNTEEREPESCALKDWFDNVFCVSQQRNMTVPAAVYVSESDSNRIAAAVTLQDIEELLQKATALFGLDAQWQRYDPSLQTSPVVKSEILIQRFSQLRPDEHAFLDSFYLDDLDRLRQRPAAQLSRSLQSYTSGVSPEGKSARLELDSTHGNTALFTSTCPSAIPEGRWPSPAERRQSSGQQAAINEILAMFKDSEPDLLGVNGPPGTGKTTLLQDVIAAIITKRAEQLATFSNPSQAFLSKSPANAQFNTLDSAKSYWRLDSRITGFEIIVASANNKAVENISLELPANDSIGKDWQDYIASRYAAADPKFGFQAIAEYIADHPQNSQGKNHTNSSERQEAAEASEPAKTWALMAAQLGRSGNRSHFIDTFWKPFRDKTINRIADNQYAPHTKARTGEEYIDAPDWEQARQSFQSALHAEHDLRQGKERLFEKKLDLLQRAEYQAQQKHGELAKECQILQDLKNQQTTAERQLHSILTCYQNLNAQIGTMMQDLPRYLSDRQTTLSVLDAYRQSHRRPWLPFTRKYREWTAHDRANQQDYEYRCALVVAQQQKITAQQTAIDRVTKDYQAVERQHQQLTDNIRNQQDYVSRLQQDLARAQQEVDEAHKSIELSPETTPWVDEAWNRARTKVFLEAMNLHQAFILNAHKQIWTNLSLAQEVIKTGGGYGKYAPEAVLAAWQTFFLVVPVISTTFQSVSRMFTGLDHESLGWALIDEAGQASPQAAVGLLQRVRHAVAVGDPLQLEPIDTLPPQIRRLLVRHHHINTDRCGTVQETVDEVTPKGMYTGLNNAGSGHSAPGGPHPNGSGDGEDEMDRGTWIGMPLVVHRRCADPMFSISNRMAYHGLMIRPSNMRGSEKNSSLPPSCWYDVPRSNNDAPGNSQWRPEEGTKLDKILRELFVDEGAQTEDILVLAPFKAVANKVSTIYRDTVSRINKERTSSDSNASESLPRLKPPQGDRSGTVHVSQGREADIVILVLGSQPRRRGNGSRNWANEKPNLFNVAVSRAKQRFYVIGSKADWGDGQYSGQILEALEQTEADQGKAYDTSSE